MAIDWESGNPIARYISGSKDGQWYPAVEVYLEEVDADGNAHQRYILHDGTPNGRYPVDRVGQKIDLIDAQTRINEWRSINKRPDDGSGD